MIDFKNYGKIVRQYSGTASLFDEDTPMPGRYRVVQYADGRIILEHKTNEPVFRMGPDILFETSESVTFQGTTAEGHIIEATDLRQSDSSIVFPVIKPGQRRRKTRATQRFRCRTLSIRSQVQLQPCRIFFALVNLDTDRRDLALNIEGADILIRPVGGSKDLMRSVKETRGIDVTAEASMRIDSLDELPDIQRRVDDLCLLLSLARGTVITWISFNVLDDHGNLVTSDCRNNYTRSYQLFYLIAPADHDSTKRFVEAAYPNLGRCSTDWNIRSVIRTYVEAKSESDVVEGRGLKLAVCMEILRTRFLENKGKTYIMPPETFEPGVPKLKSIFGDTLRTIFPEIKDAQQSAGLSKLDLIACHIAKGLNYYPFRRALREMCREVKLYPTNKGLEKAVGKYIDLRNDLVHRGKYPEDGRSEVEHYAFMDEFVGTFLLAALGYDTTSVHAAVRDFFPHATS